MNNAEHDRRRRRDTATGLRVYGAWAGRPDGVLEDVRKCVHGVWPNERAPMEHQCSRNRGHGKGGLWCRQHDPEFLQKITEDRQAAEARLAAAEAAIEKRVRSFARRCGVKAYAEHSRLNPMRLTGNLVIRLNDAERLAERLADKKE